MFGMRSSALSEVLWEVIESFVDGQGHLVMGLREGLLVSRAGLNPESINNTEAPLDSCVGSIDCTKIQMSRPRGAR